MTQGATQGHLGRASTERVQQNPAHMILLGSTGGVLSGFPSKDQIYKLKPKKKKKVEF